MSVKGICGSIVLNALTFLAIYADTYAFDLSFNFGLEFG